MAIFGEVPHKLFSSRMGSSEIFACPKNRRLHLGCFHADVRMISGTKVAEAKELVVQVQTNDPLWGYTFDNKTLKATHQLALVDWAAKYWGFVMVDSALPSDLKAERLRQNPLAVVEDSAEVAAGPPPPPMDMFWRRARPTSWYVCGRKVRLFFTVVLTRAPLAADRSPPVPLLVWQLSCPST